MSEYRKEWRENNKERITQRKKKDYQNNKEKIQQKRKKDYENNKEKILKKEKEYRENNEEKIKERRKAKITCECGSCVRKYDLSRHIRSKKHQDYLLSQIISE